MTQFSKNTVIPSACGLFHSALELTFLGKGATSSRAASGAQFAPRRSGANIPTGETGGRPYPQALKRPLLKRIRRHG